MSAPITNAGSLKKYFFKVVYMNNGCFTTHKEENLPLREGSALAYFRELLRKYKVDGMSYYLCSWGEVE